MQKRKIRTNDPTYQTIHWYLRRYKKNICVNCGRKGLTQLAKKHDKQHERIFQNYKELCVKCHIAYDRTESKKMEWLKNLSRSYSHRNRIQPKKCKQCDKFFKPNRKTQKFCSNICSGKWRYNKKVGLWLKLNEK